MAKLRILLSCSYGFSTSILVKKMTNYFIEQGYDFIVEAQPETEAQNSVDNFDVILIGPQVKYLVTKFEKIVNGRIPIYVIDSRAYGMQDVETIVEYMLDNMEADGFYER